MSEVVVLYTTWPQLEQAEAFAAEAVAERLCACANILGPMRSIYRWKGAIDEAAEIPMLLKTSTRSVNRLRDLVLARHPYETPCVLALQLQTEGSNPEFLAWVAAEASGVAEDSAE